MFEEKECFRYPHLLKDLAIRNEKARTQKILENLSIGLTGRHRALNTESENIFSPSKYRIRTEANLMTEMS